MNAERMTEQLVLHEGLRLKPYKDTEGYWTVGVGYNLSARGVTDLEKACGREFPIAGVTVDDPFVGVKLTKAEAMKVLRADILRFERAVRVHFPEYDTLSEVRQRVVLDMAFNLGFRALGFKNTIAHIRLAQWSRAGMHLYRSKWAHQVDDGEGGKFGRADRLVKMLLTNQDYTE